MSAYICRVQSIKCISEDTTPLKKAENPHVERKEPSELVPLLVKHLGSRKTYEAAHCITASWGNQGKAEVKILLANGNVATVTWNNSSVGHSIFLWEGNSVAFFKRIGFLCRGLMKHMLSLTHSQNFCLMLNPTVFWGEEKTWAGIRNSQDEEAELAKMKEATNVFSTENKIYK